jgi:hypothetical protein
MTRLDFVRTETNSNQVWLKSSHKSTRKEILIKYFFTTSLNRRQRSFFCVANYLKKRKSQPGFENFENFEPWSQR